MNRTTPQADTSELNLAPSTVHWDRMQAPPRLAYDGGDVKAWQRKLRRKLRTLLGYDRMPAEKCELNVRSLWRREHELGTIEKLVYTAEPGADVPCYLCLPKDVKPPYPVFICLQGHTTGMHNSIAVDQHDETTPIDVPGDRDFGLSAMQNGVAALCIEQRAFGERYESQQQHRFEHPCIDASMHALMLGRTLPGERVYDVERGIDLLAQRRDMDLKRVGVMGNSGGGTVTMYAAALLRRLRLAMPSCAFCTFRDSIMRIQHCPDNYVPGILEQAEISDVVGLFAPRPVVVVAGEQDAIFPVGGVRAAFEDLKRIYQAAGAPQACELVVGPEGHRFYADPAWAAMRPMLESATSGA